MEQSPKENISQQRIGMKFSHPTDLKQGSYSLLVNGVVESLNGNFIKVSNEPSNFLCSKLNGYKLIGSFPIPALSLTIVALVSDCPSGTTCSEIGFIPDSFSDSKEDREVACKDCNNPTTEPIPLELTEQKESCNYITLVNADCLNFSIDNPVRIWAKVDDCNVTIYFTDERNPLRYINYPDFQKEELTNCPKIDSQELDCNRINIFPDTCYPTIEYLDVVSGGSNTAGTLQFAVAYSDAYSNNLTNYYYIPNPIPLFDQSKTILQDENTGYLIAKSVKIRISNINSDFDWFNLVVLKTVNNITTPYLVNTFSNTGSEIEYVYSGNDKNLIKDVSIEQLLVPKATYSKAKDLTESNGYLIFQDLTEPRVLNLQPIFNKLKVQWATVEFDEGAYANPIIAANYRSFLRDETYPLAIEIFRKTNSGIKTARFHIPGRASTPNDLQDVTLLNNNPNPDVIKDSFCSDNTPHLRWQVYNTGTKTGNLCRDTSSTPAPATTTKTVELKCNSPYFYIDYGTTTPSEEFPDGITRTYYRQPCPDRVDFSASTTYNCNTVTTSANQCLQDKLADFNNPRIVSKTRRLVEFEGVTSTPAPNPCLTQKAHYECVWTIEYDVVNECECEFTTSSPFDCFSDPFYFDPNNSLYYTTPSGNITTTPSAYTDCNSCTDNVKTVYPNYCNISESTPTLELVQEGGTILINHYNPTPTPPGAPSSYPALPANPINTTCEEAISANQYTCTGEYTSLLVKLLNNGSGTQTLWYSFNATSDAMGITISAIYNQTTGNSFNIKMYETTDNFCTGLVTTPLYDVTQSNPYFLLENLTQGKTYFFTIAGQSNVSAGVNDFYYLCIGQPTPISQSIEYLRDTYRIHCHFDVSYCVNYSPCEGEPHEYGTMGYIESTEYYLCNTEVWGDLANTPIRHHKFPDCKTSPYFKNLNPAFTQQNLYNSKTKIYPLGLKIDVEEIKILLKEAEANGYITKEERLSFCGYRILRGNRRGNESIIAKGLLYDVWKYRDNIYKTQQDVLYPNYPYNPRNLDVFNLQNKLENNTSVPRPIEHPYTSQNYVNNKYTFLGANTLFNNPGLGEELKLELELFGISEGRYTEVINHAKYQYSGIGAAQAAFGFASLESMFDAIGEVNQGGLLSAAVLSPMASFIWGSKVPNHYYDWLDIIRKLAPIKNFAWYFTSVGNYADYTTTNIVEGNIRRQLNDAQYLKQGVFSVKDGGINKKINNFKREGSVYLNLSQVVDNSLTDPRDYFLATSKYDDSRWFPGDGLHNCDNIGDVYSNISSYYASIKNNSPNQYGTIGSIEYIDTGFNGVIDWDTTQTTECTPIFGGDQYLCRLSERKQFPFFLQDRVGYPLNSDVQYNELSNVGYPRFFFNYPTGTALTGQGGDFSALFGDVALVNNFRYDYSFNCREDTGAVWLFAAANALGISNSLASGNIVAGIGVTITNAAIFGTYSFGDPRVYINGKFFLYSYGEPSFITESDYNLDYRYGINQTFGNFYPNVGDMVTWTQPTQNYNLINYDNTHFYNTDYSRQNRENLGFTLNPDFSQAKEDCKTEHSNRVMYSIQDNDNNDRFDGNKVFLPNNFFDFNKAGGRLSIVKGIENNKVLVIQENQASLFNSFVTLQTNIGSTAVGSNNLFSQQPAQYIKTDLGYAGSQTNAITSTEFGHFWVDNKRGQIFNLQGQLKDITLGENSWWFKEFLPFKILKDFPDANINNNFKWFGMAITYDSRLKRILFTKRDAELLPEYKGKVSLVDNLFKLETDVELTPSGYSQIVIEPTDSTYFCNKSFTISWNPLTNSFTSFLTYTPNYYLNNQSYFSSGVNFPTSNEQTGVWNHLLNSQSYQCFYGNLNGFALEYSVVNTPQNQILNSVSLNVDFNRFINQYDFYKTDKIYSDVIIYNQNQTTGYLNLVLKQKNNLYQSIQYPKVKDGKTQILIENVENFYSFNNFYNIYAQNKQPIMHYECNPYKVFNEKSVHLTPKFFKNNLRSDYFQIRLENNIYSNYQIVHKFTIEKESPSNI